jgi:hypothetical protein
MNITNIVSLRDMLVAIGFDESLGYRLLQYVCFKPAKFVLTEHLAKGKDVLTCAFCFERKGDDYVCIYYDASLIKEMEVPDISVQNTALRELDKRMAETDWQLDGNSINGFDLDNEANLLRIKRVEGIITDLIRLSVTDDGKRFADLLKLKHWSNIPFNPMMGSLNPLRSRFEVCQRFYFYDGKGISVDEAYRFLVNRWLEKKIHGRKRPEDSTLHSGHRTHAEFHRLRHRTIDLRPET